MQEVEQELELAKLMVKDLGKLWKSYAKKALEAKTEREAKQEKKGFLNCETADDLLNLWEYAEIDEDTYRQGLDYFENIKKPKLSVLELHRRNIKELLDRFKGTVNELEEEISPTVRDTENAFDKLDILKAEEHAERYKGVYSAELLDGNFIQRGNK